ncbi:hypothetical protein RhiirA5_409399 [Rhizophagus irregularis]|uniref:Uncharacterized protein n=1 Tax=Rhizophagus irregularis TaxID=588596 RepID=A0A2N0Q5U3_9GLOM|nr:hypothetical protein RhiirA5_409399 [Rhizophagus irregularis]GET51457.1 hypothetical protein RIR_e26756_A0A2N0Q5U3_9GLOM [Rhizophagus irregularis DAOM 181602=DAOM 197198]
MEWAYIRTEAIEEMKDANGLKTDEEFKDCQSGRLRLKNENKATDGKDTGDKRVKNSPPEKKFKKR